MKVAPAKLPVTPHLGFPEREIPESPLRSDGGRRDLSFYGQRNPQSSLPFWASLELGSRGGRSGTAGMRAQDGGDSGSRRERVTTMSLADGVTPAALAPRQLTEPSAALAAFSSVIPTPRRTVGLCAGAVPTRLSRTPGTGQSRCRLSTSRVGDSAACRYLLSACSASLFPSH